MAECSFFFALCPIIETAPGLGFSVWWVGGLVGLGGLVGFGCRGLEASGFRVLGLRGREVGF